MIATITPSSDADSLAFSNRAVHHLVHEFECDEPRNSTPSTVHSARKERTDVHDDARTPTGIRHHAFFFARSTAADGMTHRTDLRAG
ncbi:hypothetical protein [Saccharopolyspora flava]|uniref:hypothetical protein n=1 Tax=Saccharopolyspora flava TaxID=95161 RepID=UPI001114D93D|nr:hypothetical protein [Saccharopolyspora flava]